MKRLAVFLACAVTFTGMSSNVPVQAKVKSGTWWAIGIVAVGVGVYMAQRDRQHRHEFRSPTNAAGAGSTMGTMGTSSSTMSPDSSATTPGTNEGAMTPGAGSSSSSSDTTNKGASLRSVTPGAYHLSYTPIRHVNARTSPLRAARMISY